VRAWTATLPIVLCLALAAPAAQPSGSALTPVEADRFAEKLERLLRNAPAPGHPHQASSIVVTEQETNAFLRYRGQTVLPAGVVSPRVSALGEGRLQGWATVDLDAVRESKERGWLDPMRLLSGRLPVTATGVLHAQGGTARFDLESASVSGIPVPRAVLQELVSYYTRGVSHPEGVSLDEPFSLPAGIREIMVQPGRAIIVQ
jgi:hypothetical protein